MISAIDPIEGDVPMNEPRLREHVTSRVCMTTTKLAQRYITLPRSTHPALCADLCDTFARGLRATSKPAGGRRLPLCCESSFSDGLSFA